MGLLNKTPEERAAKEHKAYLATPLGRAHSAFERGDHIFQIALAVNDESTVLLNAIHGRGWDLVAASVTFIQTGQSSTNKMLATGQFSNVTGKTLGLYVFSRRG